jgi:mRNA interferase MazF
LWYQAGLEISAVGGQSRTERSTSTVRGFHAEITIEPDAHNGLTVRSAVQCQHLEAVSTGRTVSARGNVGPATLAQIRETIAMLDIPV